MSETVSAEAKPIRVADEIVRAAVMQAYPTSVWALLSMTDSGTEEEPDMSLGLLMRPGVDFEMVQELCVMLLESQGFTVVEPEQASADDAEVSS